MFAAKAPKVLENQCVPGELWSQLVEACHRYGIVLPNLSFNPVMCTNTIAVCKSDDTIPWYHSLLLIGEVIHHGLHQDTA